MQESPKFKIVVVTTKREKSPEEVAQEKLLFLGMESGLLLVGKSRSHTQMLHDYCFQEGRGHVALERFVEGSYENGAIEFEKDTPRWKQAAVEHFLVGYVFDLLLLLQITETTLDDTVHVATRDPMGGLVRNSSASDDPMGMLDWS